MCTTSIACHMTELSKTYEIVQSGIYNTAVLPVLFQTDKKQLLTPLEWRFLKTEKSIKTPVGTPCSSKDHTSPCRTCR